MSSTPSPVAADLRRASLRREIIAVLVFKLLALIVLRFVFFDERPHITPTAVEQRVFEPSLRADPASDLRNLP